LEKKMTAPYGQMLDEHVDELVRGWVRYALQQVAGRDDVPVAEVRALVGVLMHMVAPLMDRAHEEQVRVTADRILDDLLTNRHP
jgi:hypothetical protein